MSARAVVRRLAARLAGSASRAELCTTLTRVLSDELGADLAIVWVPADPSTPPRAADVYLSGERAGRANAGTVAREIEQGRLDAYLKSLGLPFVAAAGGTTRAGILMAAWTQTPEHAAENEMAVESAAALIDAQLARRAADDQLLAARHTLQEAETQIALTRRARVVGELASGIVHDFNNCLTTVIGFAELALGALDEASTCHADVKTIRLAAMDAATLVKRLQTMGRGSEEERCVMDLRTIAKAMPELVRPRWTRRAQIDGVSFEVVVDPQPAPKVHVIVGEIRELLMNLLFNAIDAMPAGGRITITTGTGADGRAQVLVHDEGVGIDPDLEGRLFQPFTTTKGTAGSGLGLSVCRSIAERHDGTLTLESAPGQGTTFILSLPPAPAPLVPAVSEGERASAEAAQLEPPVRPAHSAIGRRILLVDDQQEVRESVGEMLRALGHSVVLASDGQAALAAAVRQPLDVVLTDFGMPEMNGAELGARLLAIAPRTPVLLMSGWGLDDDVPLPENVVHVLGKPLTMKTLEEALSRDGVLGARMGA